MLVGALYSFGTSARRMWQMKARGPGGGGSNFSPHRDLIVLHGIDCINRRCMDPLVLLPRARGWARFARFCLSSGAEPSTGFTRSCCAFLLVLGHPSRRSSIFRWCGHGMLADPRLKASRQGTLGLLLRSKVEKTPELAVGPLFAWSLSLTKLVKKHCGCRDILALLGNHGGPLLSWIIRLRLSSLQHMLVQHIVVTIPTTVVAYLTHWSGHWLLWEGLGPSDGFRQGGSSPGGADAATRFVTLAGFEST